MNEASQNTSPLALVALLTGVIGLAFSFLGCMFSPFLFVAAALCLVAILLGALEIQKINAGQSSEANKMLAMAGVGTGLGGCTIGLIYMLFLLLIVVVYFAFVVVVILATALGGGTGGP